MMYVVEYKSRLFDESGTCGVYTTLKLARAKVFQLIEEDDDYITYDNGKLSIDTHDFYYFIQPWEIDR